MYVRKGSLKKAIELRTNYACEVLGCSECMNSIHHIVKVSVYPEIKHCYEFVMGCCGVHHAEIEQKLREGISDERYKQLYPAWVRLRCTHWYSMSKEGRNIYLQHCTFYRHI